MTPEQYDAWYDRPRGRWIGELEWTAVRDALRLQSSDTALDVGCGTSWFTRRAESMGARVVGLDVDASCPTGGVPLRRSCVSAAAGLR